MNIKIEFRYAVLTSLVMLLWLITEYTIGLQDNFIAWHPYVSTFAFALIPLITYRLALREKTEEKYGKLSFKQAFLSGFIITVFASIIALPMQYGFIKVINPDYFANSIAYAIQKGQRPEMAAHFFNLTTYLTEAILFTFFAGLVVSLILAFRMRTIK